MVASRRPDGAPAVPDGIPSETMGYGLGPDDGWGDGAAHEAPSQRAQSRILCLLTRRWKVLRSMPAALAAAEMLPSWRSSRSRRYDASRTAIQRSLASFSPSPVVPASCVETAGDVSFATPAAI